MPERGRRGLMVLLVLLVTVAVAVVAVELRTGDQFGHGRHDDAEWRPILDERFDGTTLDTELWNTCHWWAEDGCTIQSNHELQWYLPSQVAVADGVLRLTAAKEPATGTDGKQFEYRS